MVLYSHEHSGQIIVRVPTMQSSNNDDGILMAFAYRFQI